MKRFLLLILTLLLYTELYATGTFSTGFLFAVDGQNGAIDKIRNDINHDMRLTQYSDPSTSINEIDTIYSPSLSINFRYFYDRFMMQLAWEYSTCFFFNEKGSITPSSGDKNTIELKYSRFTFPFTMAIILPAWNNSRFFIGGGLNLSFMMLEVNKSDYATLTRFPDKKNTYSGYIPGFHFKIGAETTLSRNYSISFEYIKYMSKNFTVKSDNGNSEIYMGLNSFEIGVGINYNVNSGI
ncbi:MAG TPA: hypothetical protein PKX79_11215 [Spirochaetota bacterium]|jgi:hypothetical protein|nr:hypothetical protein [Spirochaetota bacterium]HPP95934.1 hypothetical protein [Spirochaetota bacterium]